MSPATRGAARGILDEDPTRIRLYDFTRQETIERGRLRLLRPALETVAGRVSSTLSSGVRQIVRASIPGDIAQQTWEEFAPSLPDPTFVVSASISPFERRFVLHVPVPLALLLLDYHLGGDGQRQPERDELTDMERAILLPLIDTLWRESILPPLSAFLDLGAARAQCASNPIFVQVGRPGEVCLIVELAVTVADSPAYPVALALPVSIVTPIIDSIERAHSGVTRESNEAAVAQVDANLRGVAIELKASYPSVQFTPAELADLAPGDVLPLRPRPEVGRDVIELAVNETIFAHGVLVEEGLKLAVSITKLEEAVA